jgi:hypothetical protein
MVRDQPDPDGISKRAAGVLKRTPGFAFVVILVIAALVTTTVLRLRPDPGPLEPPLGSSMVGTATATGIPWTAAAVDLPPFEGSDDAVLDSVEAVDVTGGVAVIGYRVVEPTLGGGIEIAQGFPPLGYSARAVAGTRYGPSDSPPQIVVGVRATGAGKAVIAGFRLRYHVGDHAYVASFAQGVYLCVPDC